MGSKGKQYAEIFKIRVRDDDNNSIIKQNVKTIEEVEDVINRLKARFR